MGTLLFDTDTLETLNREDVRGYLFSFSSLLLREVIDNWSSPQTTLNIDISGHPTPHIATLRKHIDTFLYDHEDGGAFVQWLAYQSYRDFAKHITDMASIFEQTFRHSYRSRFPNINPGSLLLTLGESLTIALQDMADEEEEDADNVQNIIAKTEFLRDFLRKKNDLIGGEYAFMRFFEGIKSQIRDLLRG